MTVNDNDTAQVTGVSVTPGNAQLAVNWTAVDNATGYKVQWKSGSQNYNTGSRQFTVTSGTMTSHTITGLTNGTEYTVRVSATRTGANDGPPSAEETGTPAVPIAPGVTVSTTALTVTEQDPTGDSYTVALDTQPTATVTVTVAGHAGTDVTPNPTTLTFTSTTWSTAQTVTVTAGDDADTTDDSVTLTHSAASADSNYSGIAIDEVAVTVSDNDTAQVTGVSVTSGNAQLVVNWTAVDNATGYKVQWKSGSQNYNTDSRQFTVTSGTMTSHTITGLTNGTEYTVRVSVTRTGANDGPPSAEDTSTPAVATSEPLTLTVEAMRDTVSEGEPVSYRIVMSRRTPGVEVGTVYRYEGEFVRNAPSSTITGISSRGSVLYWEVERDTLDDAVFEADGEFTVRLQPGAGYTLGTPSSATVRILDNDGPGDPPTSPPPVVSLADARVREGPGAELAFSVRLDRAPVETATVDWETLDGSAKAGEDYVAASGTLAFGPGETVKTVRVAVIDDAHDEGHEVMLLVLPNAQGAVIGDAVAKGTIENSDRMPAAWLARFGRAASDHVVEAVGDRWQGGPQASHLTLGGRQAGQLFGWSGLGGRTGRDTTVDRDEPVGTDPSSIGLFAPSGGAGAGLGATAPGMGVSGMNAMPGGPGGVERKAGRTLSGRAAQGALLRALGLPDPRAVPDLRTVLMGSSFFYSAALDGRPGRNPVSGTNPVTGLARGVVGVGPHRGDTVPGQRRGNGPRRRGGHGDARIRQPLGSVAGRGRVLVQRRPGRLHAPDGERRRGRKHHDGPSPLRAFRVERAHERLGRARVRRGRAVAHARAFENGARDGSDERHGGVRRANGAVGAHRPGRSVRAGGAFRCAADEHGLRGDRGSGRGGGTDRPRAADARRFRVDAARHRRGAEADARSGASLRRGRCGDGRGARGRRRARLRGRAAVGAGRRAGAAGPPRHRVRGMGVQRFDRLHPVGGRARVVDAARFGLGRHAERRAVAVEPPGRLGAGEERGVRGGATLPGRNCVTGLTGARAMRGGSPT